MKPIRVLTGIAILVASSGLAQDSSRDLLDGTTPPGIAPGAAISSQPLSKLESINLFSGGLNFSVPLLVVGGRGDVSYPITVPIETRWIVENVIAGSTQLTYPNDGGTKFSFVGYGPMFLEFRRVALQNICGVTPYDDTTLTRLHLISPDGNDQELIDTKSNGTPQSANVTCGSNGANAPTYYTRGRSFVSNDASDSTYEQDANLPEIDDSVAGAPPPTGYLYLKDGTRYRVVAGLVQWMSDRNGNQITFDRTGDVYNRVVQIKDPLGRTINIEYGNVQNSPHPNEDWIKYTGTSASPRIIKVRFADLANLLRDAGWTTKEVRLLFPLASQNVNTYVYNPKLVSEIEFPNGQKYQFRYDSYGELSRATLPTGGVTEYDWASFTTDPAGMYEPFMVYRRLSERRVYAAPSALEGKTTYSVPLLAGGGSLTVTVTEKDSSGAPVRTTLSTFLGTPLNAVLLLAGSPLASVSWKEGRLSQVQVQNTGGATLRQTVNTWQQRNPTTNQTETSIDSAAPSDPRITQVQQTLGSLTAKTTYTYTVDPYNNVSDECHYDYGATQATTCVSRSFETSSAYIATPAHFWSLVTQETTKGLNSSGNLVTEAQTTYQYDQYSTSSPLLDRANISQHDTARGASTTSVPRGNPTTVSRLLPSAPGSLATTRFQYDIAGNVTLIDHPEVQTATGLVRPQTTASYADNYDSNPAAPTFALPTSITHPGNLITTAKYKYALGKILEFRDPNNNLTSYQYGDMVPANTDALERLTNVTHPVGTTKFTYQNTSVTTTKSIESGIESVITQAVDGLGRASQTTQTDSYHGAPRQVVTARTYDALGRVRTVSNPGSGSPGPVTTTSYDELDRPTALLYPDNSQTNSCYANNATLTQDPANKFRKTVSDALGRLTQVVEDPTMSCGTLTASGAGYSTTYSYDGRGNLLTVNQVGRNRSFTYDEVGRLKTASSPETGPAVNEGNPQSLNGIISYSYDPAGNLTQRIDPRNVTTTLTYDLVSRVAQKTYSDGTPLVSLCYDGDVSGNCSGAPSGAANNLKGHLTRLKTSVATMDYRTYDVMGRVTQSEQSFGAGTPYVFHYTYNDVALKTLQYPSNRTVTYGYDAGARVVSVLGQMGATSTPYVSAVNYAAFGAPEDMTMANSQWEQTCYNNRMQATSMLLRTQAPVAGCPATGNQLQVTFTFPATNNGNISGQTISDGASWSVTQNYTYDALNRLASAQETGATGWKETFGYDQWGNQWVDPNPSQTNGIVLSGNTPTASTWFTDKNRLNLAQGTYDLAGNQLKINPYTLAYDAENRLMSVTSQSNGSASYAYDGEGRRVKKVVGSLITYYVYDAMGQLAAEYQDGTDTTPQHCTTCYLFADHLGSTRAMWDANGVQARYDYLPFGDMVPTDRNSRTAASCAPSSTCYGITDKLTQRFTSKERDAETGLDYFGARYMSSAQGRFTSADPKQFPHDIPDPQSWNKYSYTRNNPLRYTDPDGEDWQDVLKGAINGYTSSNTLNAGRIPSSNGDFRLGQALGDAVAVLQGTVETLAGTGGEVGGVALDLTGVGAVVGVPLNVASGVAIVHGGTVAGTGLANLGNAVFSSSTNDTPSNTMGGGQVGEPNGPKPGSSGGPGAGRKATSQERGQALQENNGNCVFCGKSANEADHSIPKSRNGNNTTGPNGNLQPTCTNCNRGPGGKHAQTSEEFLRKKQQELNQ